MKIKLCKLSIIFIFLLSLNFLLIENIVLATQEKQEEIILDESNSWKQELELTKYDDTGALILYSIDEKEVEGYTKEIDGTTITNKINNYNYTIEHSFNGMIDNELTEIKQAPYGSKIENIEEKTKVGYVLDKSNNLPLVISSNEKQNKVIAQYRALDFNLGVDSIIEKVILNGDTKPANSKLSKVEVSRKQNENHIKIFYKIKVTNDRELDGKATLCDYIPNGLAASQEDNADWIIDGNKAYRNVALKIGETKEFQIILTNIDLSIIANVQNKVILEDITNEAGFEETSLLDNEDKTDVIITVATGWDSYIKVILNVIFIVLVVIAFVLLFIRLKKNGDNR